MFAQSTIWMPHNANIDTMMGTRWMSAVSANTVWEVGYSKTHATAVSNKFTRTQNGNTFTPGTFMAISDTNYFNSSNITAVNDSVAYIPMYFIPGTGRAGRVKKTMNRGVTWTICSDTTTMFLGANNFPDWGHFYTNNHGLVLGDPNGNYFEIYKTYNGGTNWTRIPQAAFTPSVTPAGEYGVTDVVETYKKKHLWFGTNHGGAVTTASHIYRSNDTGNTWKSAAVAGINAGVSGIAFRDSLHGFAWGYNTAASTAPFVLVKTSDGGITWTTSIQHNNVGIFDISEVPGRNAFVSVGLDSSHASYITSITYDDGLNWFVLESGTLEAQRMIKLEMLDSAHAWAGCFSDNTNIPFGTSGMCTWMGGNIPVCPLTSVTAAPTNSVVCNLNSATLHAGGAVTYQWTGSLTSNMGANVTTTTYTAAGTYTYSVMGTDNMGCYGIATTTVTVLPCVGINEIANGIASIYPNPSNGNITIDFGNAAAGTKVVVTDMIGNNVYQSIVNSGISELKINLTSMPKGMYLVTVSNTTGSTIKKMIIE